MSYRPTLQSCGLHTRVTKGNPQVADPIPQGPEPLIRAVRRPTRTGIRFLA